MTCLAALGRTSWKGVGAWDEDRRQRELPILRRSWPTFTDIVFPGDGIPGPLPKAGDTWTRRGTWWRYSKRPIRCRVLSVEYDEHGPFVRVYVGTRHWYDGAPGTLRFAVNRFRAEWFYGRREGVIEFPTPASVLGEQGSRS